MGQDRAKRRSDSQRIGELGESIFRQWAIEQGLSPTKPEYDYGIDFVCNVFSGKDAEEVTGILLAVQVRSTSAEEKQRIKMERPDAETALRTNNPYVLVGVDVASRKIYFRFMDESFMDELHKFLLSDNESRSWTLDSMDNGRELFLKALHEISRPAYQQKLRWKRAELNISAVVPGSSIFFSQNKHGGVVFVEAPFLTDFLDIADSEQESVADTVFNEGCLSTLNESLLRPEILSLTKLIDGPICIGGAFEQVETISVESPGGPRIAIPVSVRKIGDEIGYVLKNGLYLIISAAREKDGNWVHVFRHGIAVKNAVELDNATTEFQFLKSLKAGALIYLPNGAPISIDHWENLEYLGPDIEALEEVFAYLKMSFSGLYLADAVKQNMLISISIFKALLDGIGIEQIFPGFVYEQATGGKLQDSFWKPCKFRIPIVMNLNSSNLIIWSSGKGSVYIVDNVICGFRLEEQEEWEFEFSKEHFREINVPELWVCKSWPPVPINLIKSNDCISLDYKTELPFAGEFYGLQD